MHLQINLINNSNMRIIYLSIIIVSPVSLSLPYPLIIQFVLL